MHPLYGASASYTAVNLCASLQNLAVPHDFFPLPASLGNDLVNPVIDSVGLSGFKGRANAFSLT